VDVDVGVKERARRWQELIFTSCHMRAFAIGSCAFAIDSTD
jgi:hypothetical protein